MYGPCGSPRVYAYSNSPSPSAILNESRDAIEAEKTARDEKSQTVSEQVDLDGIIGLQVSRSGHLFATITSASVCIWSTRVSSSRLLQEISDTT